MPTPTSATLLREAIYLQRRLNKFVLAWQRQHSTPPIAALIKRPNGHLTDAALREVIIMIQEGHTDQEIMNEFDLSLSTVQRRRLQYLTGELSHVLPPKN